MTLIDMEYNPLKFATQHPVWASVTALAILQGNPRLANALVRSGAYWFGQQFRDAGAVGKIFLQEFTKPAGQVKPIISPSNARAAVSNKVIPTLQRAATVVKPIVKNPYVIGGTIAVGVTTAGMVKQNPPPLIAFQRVPV